MAKRRNAKTIIEEIREKCDGEIKKFEKLFRSNSKQLKSNSKTYSHPFNLIQELHIDNKSMYENAHTRVLGAVLKYNNMQFLHSFLERCGCNIYVQKTKVEVAVERQYEKGKNGVWQQKKNSGKPEGLTRCRPDCLVWKKDHFAVIIENKINGAGETQHQVDNYIEAIIGDKEIFPTQCEENKKKIWVIYLGGDTVEMPSDNSLSTTNKLFLHKDTQGNRRPGKHLSLVSYKDVIIPWLEEDVLPECPFGMTGLTGGVMVYIDYLTKRFEDDLSEEEKIYNSSKVVELFQDEIEGKLKPFYYERYNAVSDYLADNYEDQEKNDKEFVFFKALRHYYLNHYFRFSIPENNERWVIRTTGAFVHMWKKTWERIQDKPHPTCDLYFELYPYQIDNYISNPTDFIVKKRAVTCCLNYKGKDDRFRVQLNQQLKFKGIPEIGEFVFNKNAQKNGTTLNLEKGVFFDSFVEDGTIRNICGIIEDVLKENL